MSKKDLIEEKGSISVHTENLFPIIKKSLYSDHEIFLRELVSNAVDATQKLNYLYNTGDFQGEIGETKITISIDQDAKTLTFSDNGIGMSADEVKKYINQVAFSGAEEFVQKFKDAGENDEIIGHFGLGFYSAFMVADKVEIHTKSFKEDAEPVIWECEGSTNYEMKAGTRENRGTDITLHIADDSLEFLENSRIQFLLDKYCKFLPIEIEFDGKIVNNTKPIWKKKPSELTDEDYEKLFEELYPYSEKPLFWIHLNVDFPFNLTGILYFPRISQNFDSQKNKISLYSRQVFITNSLEAIVPDFLMLLQGVIDSPDIPLNVSRSFLQADGNVKKISNYITKKVADKLNSIFKEDRTKFEEIWPKIDTFVKYGMLSDEKFYDKATKFALLKNIDNQFFTFAEYKEKIAPLQTEKDEKLVYIYTNDSEAQDLYIQQANNANYDVLKFSGLVDSHWLGHLEMKLEKTSFKRVDSETVDQLVQKDETDNKAVDLAEDDKNAFMDLFKNQASEFNFISDVKNLGEKSTPLSIVRPEFFRRMQDMQSSGMVSGMGNLPEQMNLIINFQHPKIQAIYESKDEAKKSILAKKLMDLALLTQNMLKGKRLTDFVERSWNLNE